MKKALTAMLLLAALITPAFSAQKLFLGPSVNIQPNGDGSTWDRMQMGLDMKADTTAIQLDVKAMYSPDGGQHEISLIPTIALQIPAGLMKVGIGIGSDIRFTRLFQEGDSHCDPILLYRGYLDIDLSVVLLELECLLPSGVQKMGIPDWDNARIGFGALFHIA